MESNQLSHLQKQSKHVRTQVCIPAHLYDVVVAYADKNALSFNAVMLLALQQFNPANTADKHALAELTANRVLAVLKDDQLR